MHLKATAPSVGLWDDTMSLGPFRASVFVDLETIDSPVTNVTRLKKYWVC